MWFIGNRCQSDDLFHFTHVRDIFCHVTTPRRSLNGLKQLQHAFIFNPCIWPLTWFTFAFNERVEKCTWLQLMRLSLSGAPALQAHLKFGHKDPSEGSFNPHPRSNLCTNSQQAAPIPVVTNENVRLGLIHLSATLCCLVKPQKCVAWPSLISHPLPPVAQTNLWIDVSAPTGTRVEEILAATPSQTCRHGCRDKSLVWIEMPMQQRGPGVGREGGGGGVTKKEGGWGCEWERDRTDLSAERPVQLIPCTRAWNYLQLNDPIHRFDAPPPPTSNTKPRLTSVECLSIVCSITW